MPRFCNSCGRNVHDPDEHEVVEHPIVNNLEEIAAAKAAGREVEPNVIGVNKVRHCKRIKPIADESSVDLATGQRVVRRRYVPEPGTQRTRFNNARFVHESAFAPGGRLA